MASGELACTITQSELHDPAHWPGLELRAATRGPISFVGRIIGPHGLPHRKSGRLTSSARNLGARCLNVPSGRTSRKSVELHGINDRVGDRILKVHGPRWPAGRDPWRHHSTMLGAANSRSDYRSTPAARRYCGVVGPHSVGYRARPSHRRAAEKQIYFITHRSADVGTRSPNCIDREENARARSIVNRTTFLLWSIRMVASLILRRFGFAVCLLCIW